MMLVESLPNVLRHLVSKRLQKSRRCVIPITKSLLVPLKSCSRRERELLVCVSKVLQYFHSSSTHILVIDLNSDLQTSGNDLTSVMRQQIETQTTLENIEEAIDTLNVLFSLCLFAADPF